MEIFILAFFALGYLVLAGADIGVGMALPYLGRTPAERREAIAAIAPFFLGNEVWLVVTARRAGRALPRAGGRAAERQLPADRGAAAVLGGQGHRVVAAWAARRSALAGLVGRRDRG
ncbi:cytochrome d ubiquinol oxidase subunit II [Nonomuraea ferruginea]